MEELRTQAEVEAENYSPQVMRLLEDWEQERAARRVSISFTSIGREEERTVGGGS